MGWEIQFLDFLQTIHNPVLDVIMLCLTKLGDAGIVWIILTIIMLFIPKTRRTGIIMAVTLVIFHVSCNMIIKPLVARPRPYTLNSSVKLLTGPLKDYSFPSGHTAASFAMVTVFYLRKMKRLFIASLLLSTGIAFTRMYLYVHYPTDILAGLIIGIVLACLSFYVLDKYFEKKKINI